MGPLAEVTKAIIDLTQAPAGICANSVLATAALATQAHADVCLPGRGQRPISLYLLSVASSGERKTTADGEATRGVRNREQELRDIAKEDQRRYRNAADAYEAARNAVMNKHKSNFDAMKMALDALGDPPRKPIDPILIVTEPTVEGLVKFLANAPPSVGLFSAEGGAFLGGHSLSDEARTRSGARLSSLWDGDPLDRVRSGDGTIVITGKRVALHLMAQPDVAARFLSDPILRDQGLLSRFLTVAPAGTAGTRWFRSPENDALGKIDLFRRRVRDLLATPQRMTENGGLRSIAIDGISAQLFIEFYNAAERQLAPGGKLAAIRAFASKLAEHAGRIAAVIALYSDPNCTSVNAEAMSVGINLANHYASEALRLNEDARITDKLRVAEKLWQWLVEKKKGTIHLAEVYQTGPTELRTAAAAKEVIKILEDHGYLSPLHGSDKEPVVIDGVRRKEGWCVYDADANPISCEGGVQPTVADRDERTSSEWVE
jgi:hypothetical protein